LDLLYEIKNVINIECKELQSMSEKVSMVAVDAVNMIYESRGRIIVSGMGKPGIIGRKIAATFSSTGTPAMFVHPAEAYHGDLGIINKEDIVILISNSGETEEIVRLLPYFKRFDIKVISLTGNMKSTLAQYGDIVIDVGVSEESCPIDCAPMASTTAALVMGDALAAALMIKREFSKEHFALFHPGGNLGMKLLTRVSDLMVVGDDIPVISQDSTLKEAIIEISSKSVGATFIVDEEKRMVGIFTDGDLNRVFQQETDHQLLSTKIAELMMRNPASIEGDMLAAEAMRIMQRKRINILPVVENDLIIGSIGMHTLIQSGLA